MRKFFLYFLGVLSLSVVFATCNIYAVAENNPTIELQAKSAYVIENSTGQVIFAKNENDQRPIASMVKIMTLLVTMKELEAGRLSLDEQITICGEASGMGGSQMFIEEGDIYTVDELIKGITVVSANDASVAMAIRISGSEESFINLMNDKAKELGMKNTHFSNCTGLPAPANYSTAKDVSIMTSELIKHDIYYKYSTIWMEEYKHPDGRITQFVNTNKMIRFYEGCDSGKTGFTNESMFCLSASAKRNGMRIVSVVLGEPSSKVRFYETTKLMNMAFAIYQAKVVVDKEEFGERFIDVPNGKGFRFGVTLEDSIYQVVERGQEVTYTTKIEIANVKAPIAKGDKVGTVYILDGNNVVGSVDMIATSDVEQAEYWDYILKILAKW